MVYTASKQKQGGGNGLGTRLGWYNQEAIVSWSPMIGARGETVWGIGTDHIALVFIHTYLCNEPHLPE